MGETGEDTQDFSVISLQLPVYPWLSLNKRFLKNSFPHLLISKGWRRVCFFNPQENAVQAWSTDLHSESWTPLPFGPISPLQCQQPVVRKFHPPELTDINPRACTHLRKADTESLWTEQHKEWRNPTHLIYIASQFIPGTAKEPEPYLLLPIRSLSPLCM